MPVPSELPTPLPLPRRLAPLDAHDASYLAASARMDNFTRTSTGCCERSAGRRRPSNEASSIGLTFERLHSLQFHRGVRLATVSVCDRDSFRICWKGASHAFDLIRSGLCVRTDA